MNSGSTIKKCRQASTGNDRYSGHGYSGIDRYSGTKNPDDAILFTVSGITAIVEQKFQKFCSTIVVISTNSKEN